MTIIKWLGLLFAAWLLFHWLTAGQDEIIEGPPEIPGDVVCCTTK